MGIPQVVHIRNLVGDELDGEQDTGSDQYPWVAEHFEFRRQGKYVVPPRRPRVRTVK